MKAATNTLAEHLGAWAADLRYEDLPPQVVHAAKRMIVDTLGCAIGGYDSEPSRIALDHAATVISTQPASVLCTGLQTSPELAVFANGVMIRYLDYNDGYIGREAGHPSDSIAALLTAAEIGKADGRELIVATVIAYEMFCRMCDIVNFKPMGFDHTTIGAMASVLGAARLMGLDRDQIATALSITVAANVALYQTRIGNVSMWKGCAYANASRNAVFAAMLAERGMTGPSPVFEGVGGYFKAVTREAFELEALGGRNGAPYKIMQILMKRFPLGQYSQTVAEAAIEVRSHIDSIDDIDEIHVETLQTAIRLMAGDAQKWEPETRETADHSMPYTVAVGLVHGDVGEEYFDERYIRDPRLRALTRKVKVSEWDEANRRMPEAMLCRVTVTTKNGDRHAASVEYHRGHWKNPMTDAEVEAKFRKLALHVLPPAQVDALAACLWQLESLQDVGELMKLTAAAG